MKFFEREFWDTIKAFFDAVRTPLILIIIVIVLIFPGVIKNFLAQIGLQIESAEFLGLKLVAKSAGADLEVAANQLHQVAAAMTKADELLQQVASAPTTAADVRQKITDLVAANQQLIQTSRDTAGVVATQATQTQQEVQQLAPAPAPNVSIGPSLYVFGADPSVRSALDEIRHAQQALAASGATDVTVALFHKGNFYRSVAIFPSDQARSSTEAAIVKGVGRTGQPVSLSSWCPGVQSEGDAIGDDGKVKVPIYRC